MKTRRQFLEGSLAITGALLLPAGIARAATSDRTLILPFGEGELRSLRDGNLTLPVSFIVPDSVDASERDDFLASHQLGPDTLTPDCNLTLWKTPERTILFDAGAGTQFDAGGGLLAESLAAAGTDPSEITDVVFTHAHPDHLWGILDDFDDIAFPDAQFHMPEIEWEYWVASDTLNKTPDARKSFVVGAQNRLSRIEGQIALFRWGDEVLPGVEAVDTHGHTPGHTSFMLHAGSHSMMVVGDALSNAAISFERPMWPSGSDQDRDAGIQTRRALLDRLAADKSMLLGYHLPSPGVGYVDRAGDAFKFVMEG